MLKAIIIDDEKWARNIIKSFSQWEKYGIELVGEAEDGLQGLELIQTYEPDIVITDMEMSNMNGVSLLKELQKIDRLFKVVVISGHDDFEYMKQALQSKAIEYILKPIDASELNNALAKCVKEIVRAMDVASLVAKGLLEDEITEEMIIQIKKLRLLLNTTNIDDILATLEQIKRITKASGKSCLIQIKLLDEYVGSVIKEEFHDELKTWDEGIKYFRRYKEHIIGEATVNRYFEMMVAFLKLAIAYRLEQMRNDQKSIALLAKEYADSMYKEDIGLGIIATHLHVSKEYLSSSFKRKYGITLGHYILDLKMKEALTLLENKVPHKEIATSLGYKNLSYFYRVFRKYYKHTPKEFDFIG